jgi:hypothetical protein
LEGHTGLFLPLGTFGDNSKMGFGLVATGDYRMEKDFWLTGSIGFMSFGGKDGSIGSYSYSMPTMTIIPILAGCRYDFTQKGSLLCPYIGAELGLFIASVGSSDSENAAASSTDLGITLKGGARYKIDESWDFDGQLKFYNDFGSGASANFLGIQVGVVYSIPKK